MSLSVTAKEDANTDFVVLTQSMTNAGMDMNLWITGEEDFITLDWDQIKASDTSTTLALSYFIKNTLLVTGSGTTGAGETTFTTQLQNGGATAAANTGDTIAVIRKTLSAKANVATMNVEVDEGNANNKIVRTAGSFDNSGDSGVLDLKVKVGEDEDEVFSLASTMPKSGGRMTGQITALIGPPDEQTTVVLDAESDTAFTAMSNAPAGWKELTCMLALATPAGNNPAYTKGEAGNPVFQFYFATNPDGDLSRAGMEVGLSELDLGDNNKARSSTSFTVAFETGVPDAAAMQAAPTTVTDIQLAVTAPEDFDVVQYQEQVAQSSNVDSSAVEVGTINFLVESKYTFSVAVTDAQVKTAAAAANNVAESAVTVALDRSGGRRLASGTAWSVSITTTSQSKATQLMTSMNSNTAMATEMTNAGVTGVTVTVSQAPTATLQVQTVIRNVGGSAPPPPPDQAQLAAGLPGMQVTVGQVQQLQNGLASLGANETHGAADGAEHGTTLAPFVALLVIAALATKSKDATY